MFLLSRQFRRKHINIFDLSKISKLNGIIFIPIALIFGFSLAILYSAAGSIAPWMWKQGMYFGIFTIVAISIAMLDADTLYRLVPLAYMSCTLLLVAVMIFGHISMGARRWIDLRFIKLQPSEITKIAIILALARLFCSLPYPKKILTPSLAVVVFIVFVPFVLIVGQPDLATALICLLLAGSMCFLCGVRIEIFIALGIAIIIAIPVLWANLHDYQQKRILAFLNPEADQLGSGYNATQSKIAIGSGGFFGKGLTKGTQSQLNFLPENQTDFIFAMLAEEAGFVSCIIVLGCYAFIIIYGFVVALSCKSMFNKAIAAGSSMYFFIHVAINASMTSGLLPVAGIPMPLLSYGGSSVAISMMCIGLILHASIHQKHEHV